MELPTVDTFCSLPLRVGCIIMGIFSSGSSFIMSVLLISYSIHIREEAGQNKLGSPGGTSSKEDGIMVAIVATILTIMAALQLAKFVLDLVFVVGVIKDIRAIVLRFNIFWLTFFVIYTLAFLKVITYMDALQVMTQTLFFGQYFYYLIVSLSYIRSLEEDEPLE